jgi:hypothetical protein
MTIPIDCIFCAKINPMLLATVVLFIAYSMTYFIVSQRKMRKLRNNILNLQTSRDEKMTLLQRARKQQGRYEKEFAD